MNKDINTQTVSQIFQGIKPYMLSVAMVSVAVVLLFMAIIPQVNDLFQTISARSDEMAKLAVIKNNSAILKSTDSFALDSQLAVVLRAVPQSKDFESVLNDISGAATDAGVSLGSYEFRVGDLTKSDSTTGQFPALTVSLIINDGAAGSSRFLTKLATSLPLSEVKTIDTNAGFTNITMLFYYKSLSSLKVPASSPIPVLGAKQKQTLNQITSWDKFSEPLVPFSPVSTSSATSSAF